ncbi:putative acyl-activating enzyme 2 [Hibiscus syriacus]|uniref:Acyl-activating enzyme 2 n=1 Tax=Hibiscus syriacus TaxID=106335 RepID=A0A6A2ZPG1_HIBSY|nr:putative acyl-activating enzyme 2 [Hibiscus syriacus]
MTGLTIGDTVPNLEVETTHGKFKLHVFFNNGWSLDHPDFKPVCTKELDKMTAYLPEFEKRGVKLLAWVQGDIPDRGRSQQSKKINRVDPNERDSSGNQLPSRAMHIAGTNNNKIKRSFLYPAKTGRNMDEVLRAQLWTPYLRYPRDGDDDDDDFQRPGSWKSMESLLRCSANYVPLSPISFLERAAKVYRDSTSLVYGSRKFTWSVTHQRCVKLASALSRSGFLGISTLAPNVPALYDLHFAVPMAGAMFCTLNTRLDSAMVSVLLSHSEAKVLLVDHGDDSSPTSIVPGSYDYESFLETGHVGFEIRRPKTQGGTNICLRKVSPKKIFENIVLHNVTHMGGAPTVLNMIVNSSVTDQKPLSRKVTIFIGGSPPPPQIFSKMEELDFSVKQLYGLTETYGPGTYCDADIIDPITMESVPADSKTMGEVMFRGNTVMSGYLKDLQATKEAFRGGWFGRGDLAVKHPDEVVEAAVVAHPDNHWGQTPCAFVKLKEGSDIDAQELIRLCQDHLPHYMAPKTAIFEELARTSTGKIQKFMSREEAKALGSFS